MKTTVERVSDSVAVIGLDGELDASNYQDLITTGQGLYGEGVRTLVLDLAALEYMASSGIIALHSLALVYRGEAPHDPDAGWDAFHAVQADAESGNRQEQLRLVAPTEAIDTVLDRTGMKADPADLPGSAPQRSRASGERLEDGPARRTHGRARGSPRRSDARQTARTGLRCGRRCPDRPDRHRGPAPRRCAGVGRGPVPSRCRSTAGRSGTWVCDPATPAGLAALVGASLEVAITGARDHATRAREAQELEIGRQIQRSLLPRRFPDVPGWRFAADYEPAREVGGDLYDVFRLRAGGGTGWSSSSPT